MAEGLEVELSTGLLGKVIPQPSLQKQFRKELSGGSSIWKDPGAFSPVTFTTMRAFMSHPAACTAHSTGLAWGGQVARAQGGHALTKHIFAFLEHLIYTHLAVCH